MSVTTLTESRSFGRRLEYTLEAIEPGIKNNIFVHSPGAAIFLSNTFDAMFGGAGGPGMGSGHRVQTGGESIRVEHQLGLNTTAKNLTGPWDQIDTTPSDTVRHSRANWTDYSSTATFSVRERNENVGDMQRAAMIARETQHAMLSLVEVVAGDLYTSGGASAVTPLDSLISANDSVQGLNGATYTGNSRHPGWNARGLSARGTAVASITFDGSTSGTSDSFAVAGIQNLRTLWLNCTEGAVNPNVLITTHAQFAAYEGQITPQERYTSTRMGNLSFEALAFKTAPVIPDPYATSGTWYAINTDKVYCVVLGGADFDREMQREPENQLSFTVPYVFTGNLVCEDRAGVNKWINATA